ncbi:MAG: PA2169 family four-helix-bundle protein [Caldilineaceae bacterium]
MQRTLKHLITLNYDSVGAYEMAADLLKNEQYVQICREYVEQRNHFIDELSHLISEYGAEAPDVESMAGLMQDVWMNIRNIVSGNDTAVIVECDRGDELAIEHYHDALNKSLPEDVDILLRKQFGLLKGGHERIHRLADALQQG